MKLGLFCLMPRRDGDKPLAQIMRETIEQVVLAEALGFDTAWFAEHHFTNYCMCPSPLMMAAHCAGLTKRIRLGSAVVVLPLYDPMRLAQEIAFVDVLSGGRLVLGVGSGYQPYEFARFGADLAVSKEVFHESLDIIEMACATGEVAYEGKHYRIPPTTLSLRPLQQPMPEIYVAGLTQARDVQERIVRKGYVPFISGHWRPASALAEQRAKYDALCRELGRDPATAPLAVQRYVYIADGRKDALDAADHARYTHRLATSLRNDYAVLDGSVIREAPSEGEPPLEEIAENAIIGDPEKCIAQLNEEIRLVRPTQLSCFMQIGGMDHRRVMRSIERFGAEVMPYLDIPAAQPEEARA